MSTRQGNFKDYAGNKVAPNTCSAAVLDEARSQGLSASLAALVERYVLGFAPFTTTQAHAVGERCFYDRRLWKFTAPLASGAAWDSSKVTDYTIVDLVNDMKDGIKAMLEDGLIVPLVATTLEAWLDQKALAKENTSTAKVQTSGANIPIETSEGSKPVSIKPVTDYFVKLLFNGSYNMLKAAKWGHDNSEPQVGDHEPGGAECYFLVPKLTLGEFGTAAENNGLLFTDSEGNNVTPSSVKFQPLASGAPTSSSDGTTVTPTTVAYDGKTYSVYECSGPGWFIVAFGGSYTIDDICAHIAWEDWYDKYVGLDAEDDPTDADYNPEAAIGVLYIESLVKTIHSDGVLRVIDEEHRDWLEFGDTSAIAHHCVDIKVTTGSDWTDTEVDEGVYSHTASVGNVMKSGGAAKLLDGTEVVVEGTSVSFTDTNATVSGDKLSIKYERATEETVTKAYTNSVFAGSNIDTATGKMSINDCSIEAHVGATGTAFTTTLYAMNIVDSLAQIAQVQLSDSLQVIAEAIAEIWFNLKGMKENLRNYGYRLRVQSVDSADIPMVCGSPLVVEGSGAPSIVPMFVGQRYHDTTNNKCYEAFYVTGSTNDWKILN